MANTGRYSKLFSEAVDESKPEPSGDMDQAGGVSGILNFVLWFCCSAVPFVGYLVPGIICFVMLLFCSCVPG